VISLIGQCACLDSNPVVDEGNTEHHAEVRGLNFTFRYEGDHLAFGSGIGSYIHGERDCFGNAGEPFRPIMHRVGAFLSSAYVILCSGERT
jgi:hypothetical protein